jgi:GNAT superfamily N-acetyltransferase
MHVMRITAEETHPLRLLVLRPGGTLDDCHWPIDQATDAFHLAVERDGKRICIASFQPALHPALPGERSWQLRGMATHPVHRGIGAGRLLVEQALEELRGLHADILWCNARLLALPFYERLGFSTIGPSFEIPGIGTHYVMWRTA